MSERISQEVNNFGFMKPGNITQTKPSPSLSESTSNTLGVGQVNQYGFMRPGGITRTNSSKVTETASSPSMPERTSNTLGVEQANQYGFMRPGDITRTNTSKITETVPSPSMPEKTSNTVSSDYQQAGDVMTSDVNSIYYIDEAGIDYVDSKYNLESRGVGFLYELRPYSGRSLSNAEIEAIKHIVEKYAGDNVENIMNDMILGYSLDRGRSR